MSRLAITMLGICCIGMMQAQMTIERQSVSFGASYVQTGSISLESTLGELATVEQQAGSLTLTQGYHQAQILITDLDELDNDIAVALYPNPTADRLSIFFAEALEDGHRLELMDAGGRVVHAQHIDPWTTNHIDIDLSSLPDGQYILRLMHAEQVVKGSWRIQKIH